MINKNYRSISEVSELLKIKQHVIRYWDSKFNDVSSRLGDGKRRIFNSKNIKRLQVLKQLLHTDGKSHHSLEIARKIIDGNIIGKKINLLTKESNKKTDIDKLTSVSKSLKKLVK